MAGTQMDALLDQLEKTIERLEGAVEATLRLPVPRAARAAELGLRVVTQEEGDDA